MAVDGVTFDADGRQRACSAGRGVRRLTWILLALCWANLLAFLIWSSPLRWFGAQCLRLIGKWQG